MTEYTITLTDLEDRVFQTLTSRFNLEHETSLTPQQYIQTLVPNYLAPYVVEFERLRGGNLLSNFNRLSNESKALIERAIADAQEAEAKAKLTEKP